MCRLFVLSSLILLLILLLLHSSLELRIEKKENFTNHKSKSYNFVYLRSNRNRDSFQCNKQKLWGSNVEAQYILDLLENLNLNLNKISSNVDDLPKEIDILAYSSNVYNYETIKNIVDKNKIKIIFHLSDENGDRKIYDNIFKKIPLVYRQYRFEKYNNNSKNIKYLPLGYHCWDKNYIKTNVKPIENRKYKWCFMGSPKNNRAQDFKILKENIKPYFNERTKAGENTKISNDSIFTICPIGNVNIECYRQYGALLNGSIPILIAPPNKFKEIYNYFDIPPPFINVENIHECIDKINSLLKDKNHLQNLQNKHLEWHRNLKEKISSNVFQILSK